MTITRKTSWGDGSGTKLASEKEPTFLQIEIFTLRQEFCALYLSSLLHVKLNMYHLINIQGNLIYQPSQNSTYLYRVSRVQRAYWENGSTNWLNNSHITDTHAHILCMLKWIKCLSRRDTPKRCHRMGIFFYLFSRINPKRASLVSPWITL